MGFGIYIHIPFCKGKCPYCDFYSLTEHSLADKYAHAVIDELETNRRTSEFTTDKLHERTVTSVYFGGGTPSALSAELIAALLKGVHNNYKLSSDAEITVECNPSTPDLPEFLLKMAESGVNRASIGMQSAVDSERRALGRRADRTAVKNAVAAAQNVGIGNISLDVMLGIPLQTRESLRETLDFSLERGARHISAYMLKIEEGTRFYKMRDTLSLPDEDEVCDNYLYTSDYLAENGLPQYEISNFAQSGFESRHNLLYWKDDEYLGIGAAAHSFIDGKRFFFERSAQGFIDGESAVYDSDGGGFEEYAMLRLRLNEGITENATLKRFGFPIPENMRKAAKSISTDYIISDNDGIRLSAKGFLISNSIISRLLTGE